MFRALLTSGFHAGDMELGLPKEGLDMRVFRILHLEGFPCANLHTLSLSLSLNSWDYDPREQYVHCKYRRRDICGFATLMERLANLEHLHLRLMPIDCYPILAVDGEPEADKSKLRAGVFDSIAAKSYIDGSPIPPLTSLEGSLLPKLKSIHLSFQQISLELLLKFCIQRKSALSKATIDGIVDMNPMLHHRNVEGRIRDALCSGPGEIRST